jgi:tagatose 6-phosphate kinase
VILTVTPNPALDVTYRVGRLERAETNRVRSVVARAGGKGVNVSRVLHALGVATCATGPLGGPTGRVVAADLAALGVETAFLPIAGETRRTVVVVEEEGEEPTGLWEPGPQLAPGEWAALSAHVTELIGAAQVVVISGSVPAGVPEDGCALLVAAARARGVPVVLDGSGASLRRGLAAGPTAIKPNADELAELCGRPVSGPADALAAAAQLREEGAEAVVASLGADGLVAATGAGSWSARLPRVLHGNATGAGDAAVAGLAAAFARGAAWPEALRDAVAQSAAAVLAPVAGAVDPALCRSLRDEVVVTAL